MLADCKKEKILYSITLDLPLFAHQRLGILWRLLQRTQKTATAIITMLSQLTARTGRQLAARCAYSRSAVARSAVEPKLHNATGNWSAFKAKRPVDEEDLHVSSRCRQKANSKFPSH
jgi:hypothetical protein